MTDDERTATACIKIADAVDLILNILDAVLVVPNGDADKLAGARMLLNEARSAALGVDRGRLRKES
jgi:hypothetical protein